MCSLILGLTSFIFTLVIVMIKKKTKKPNSIKYYATIRIIIAFAAGTLIADALIHMIPDCFMEAIDFTESDDEYSKAMFWIAFYIFTGFMVFLLIEKILILSGISHNHDVLAE